MTSLSHIDQRKVLNRTVLKLLEILGSFSSHDTIGISPSKNLKVSLTSLATVKMESLCRLHAAISTSARSLRL
jgi:hypothetical protein